MDGDDMYVDDMDGDDMDDACMRGTMDGACMRGTPGPNSIFFFFSGGAEVAGWSILLEVDA
jgi:hypothetical protein